MTELVFLKLGGSLITDKRRPGVFRRRLTRRLAREVREALKNRPDLQLVLGHGAGSFGHIVAHKYHVQTGVTNWMGYAETSAMANHLNRLVAGIFLTEGVPVVSVQPSASAQATAGRLVSMAEWPVEELLRHGLVPLVYGDVALDTEWGTTIISTEMIFAYLARALHPSRIILAGEVNGVFTSDPNKDPRAQPIPEISRANAAQVIQVLSGSHGVDVTGGMASKVMLMLALVRELGDLRVALLSGIHPGRVRAALLGEPVRGTVIHP
ncbi:MAG: isopentenyl phosphate kinase family protein [Chloroflexi bacterium]|nr:isopentenyl phosphate kinase family protein [Chloroflexota bacterium]